MQQPVEVARLHHGRRFRCAAPTGGVSVGEFEVTVQFDHTSRGTRSECVSLASLDFGDLVAEKLHFPTGELTASGEAPL